MGYLVIIRKTKDMRRERTFQRRAKKLVKNEKGREGLEGEKIMKGVWYFPFWNKAEELIEEAKSCGLKEKTNVLLFEVQEATYAPKWLLDREKQAKDETKKAVEKFLNYGKEHQK